MSDQIFKEQINKLNYFVSNGIVDIEKDNKKVIILIDEQHTGDEEDEVFKYVLELDWKMFHVYKAGGKGYSLRIDEQEMKKIKSIIVKKKLTDIKNA